MKEYFKLLPFITEWVLAIFSVIASLGLVIFAIAGIILGKWLYVLGLIAIPFLLTYSAYVYEKD